MRGKGKGMRWSMGARDGAMRKKKKEKKKEKRTEGRDGRADKISRFSVWRRKEKRRVQKRRRPFVLPSLHRSSLSMRVKGAFSLPLLPSSPG